MAKKTISKKIMRDIKEYVKILKDDNLPIDKVVLFGSFARGREHGWSDIDLCVVSPKFKNALKATQYLWLKRPRDIRPVIEPIGFSPKDFADQYDSLIAEIKTTGVEIPV